MENIKQDLINFIDCYLSFKGGDISPLDDLSLNKAIDLIVDTIERVKDSD